jgi:NAD(P)-dependent dehydrogenase (short-subunit alcohol dehydrogenase family)
MARRGAVIAACDLDEAAAKATVESLGSGQEHRAFQVDVSSESAMDALAADVAGEFGRVDVLINNAGVLGQLAPIDQLTTEELQWVIGIDLWGVIYGTRAFLPFLRARPEASLVNVSSLAGLMGSLGNAGYYTAKFGVRGFSEAIRAEVRKTGIAVTIVYPGVVKTNLGASHYAYTDAEREEAIRLYNAQPGVSPERAGRKIARAIERKKARVLIGPDSWGVDKFVRIVPGNTDRFIHSFVARMGNKQRVDGRKVFE